MRNKIKKIIIILSFLILISFNVSSNEQFNFDVKEIIILENGNKFVGKNRGVITTDSGIIINADTFEYYKKSNIFRSKTHFISREVKEIILLVYLLLFAFPQVTLCPSRRVSPPKVNSV